MKRSTKELAWLAGAAATSLALAWASFGFSWPEPTLVFHAPYSAHTDSPWSRAAVVFALLVVARVLFAFSRRRAVQKP